MAKTAIKKTFAVDADDDDGNVDAAASEGMKKNYGRDVRCHDAIGIWGDERKGSG